MEHRLRPLKEEMESPFEMQIPWQMSEYTSTSTSTHISTAQHPHTGCSFRIKQHRLINSSIISETSIVQQCYRVKKFFQTCLAAIKRPPCFFSQSPLSCQQSRTHSEVPRASSQNHYTVGLYRPMQQLVARLKL